MSARIVVLEGPDGAGKTTLANRLRADLGWGYRHEGPVPAGWDALDHYSSRLYDAVLESLATRGVVLDRFAMGECVYGPVYRGVDGLGPDGWRSIREALYSIGAVQVLCLPSVETCLEHWSKRNAVGQEMLKKESQLRAVHAAYSEFTCAREGQVVYDWTRGPETEYKRVLEAIG